MIVSIFSPDTVGGNDFDAIWRGLSTIAGSWIGGGANQAAMFEIFKYTPEKYGAMVLVDIVVANIWMAVILLGVGRSKQIDRWLKADTSDIETLKQKVIEFTARITKVPTLNDYMMMLFLAFTSVGAAHFFGDLLSEYLTGNFDSVRDPKSFLSFLGSGFFWMVVLATMAGIGLSFTKAKNYEGTGASKIGGVFIYILVATIGMKMDLGSGSRKSGLDRDRVYLDRHSWSAPHLGGQTDQSALFLPRGGKPGQCGWCRLGPCGSGRISSFFDLGGRIAGRFGLCSGYWRCPTLRLSYGNRFKSLGFDKV